MDQVLDTPAELIDLHLQAEAWIAPVILSKLVLPGIVGTEDTAEVVDPRLELGSDGPSCSCRPWRIGTGRGTSEAALRRAERSLPSRLGDQGVHAYNPESQGSSPPDRNSHRHRQVRL